MSTSLKLLLIFVAVAESRILPGITSFEKELSFEEKQIILGRPFITENESFLYAICFPLLKTFDEKHCNVSVETPAFANATYKDTCTVSFAPDNPRLETSSKLELYAFGDDKVLFSWLIRDRDYRPKSARVRILNMSTCKSIDVPIAHEDIAYLVPYKSSFDVMLPNKTFCKGTTSCRQTYSDEGKKLVDSSPILNNYKYKEHRPIMPRLSDNSLFAIFAIEGDEAFPLDRVFKIGSDGKGTEISSYPTDVGHASFTEGYNYFGVCTVTANTKVNCRQYDAKVNIKMNANLQFDDEALGSREYVRWTQPHNLQDGGMLIVSGSASGPDANRFDQFSVMKLHQDGRRERPLVVDSLNFECSRIQSLRVAVSENHIDEYCFHFACKRQVFDQHFITSNLKFATKCMPRLYLTMGKRRASIISY